MAFRQLQTITLLFGLLCAVASTQLLGNNLPSLAQRVLKRHQNVELLSAKFVQTKVLKDIGIEIESHGTLRLSPGQWVEWAVQTPSPMTVMFRKGEIRLKHADGAVDIIDLNKKSLAETFAKESIAFLKLFFLQEDHWRRSFEIEVSSANSFRLKPKESKLVAALEVTVSSDFLIEKARIIEVSGDVIAIEFEAPVLGKP